ncbi:MAG TPA: hypothetical protein VHO06_09515 [Polyangia bacterium]|nr:hypothetical protein [Polyangia bacterium]
METTSAAANDASSPYERYADIFSLVHKETHSIAAALEIVDAYRAREQRPVETDIAARVIAIAASLFSLTPWQVIQPGRHRDKTSARYVAAAVLSRQHWSSGKIAAVLQLESSTVRHGLVQVERNDHLRAAACTAELLLLGLV